MIKIKQDPLNISISLMFSLNLLEENRDYNINEIKSLSHLTHHWITIQKYLKIFNTIQKYCPKFELNGSKLKILESKIYQRLSEKEKFILYLYNNQAFDDKSAIHIDHDFNTIKISETIGYLYEKTDDNKFYLKKSGLNKYNLIKQNLIELIYSEKDLDEVFKPIEYIELYEGIIHKFWETKEHASIFFTMPSISASLEGTSAGIMTFNKEKDLTTQFIK